MAQHFSAGQKQFPSVKIEEIEVDRSSLQDRSSLEQVKFPTTNPSLKIVISWSFSACFRLNLWLCALKAMATNGEEDSAKWLYVRPDPKMLVVVRRVSRDRLKTRMKMREDLLVREKRREWMGCWGLLGVAGGCWGLLGLSWITMDHFLIPYVNSTSKKRFLNPWFGCGLSPWPTDS